MALRVDPRRKRPNPQPGSAAGDQFDHDLGICASKFECRRTTNGQPTTRVEAPDYLSGAARYALRTCAVVSGARTLTLRVCIVPSSAAGVNASA
jgi:hypothetical protein